MTKYVLSEPKTTVVEGGTEIYAAKVCESLGTVNGVEEKGAYVGWRNFTTAKEEGDVLETIQPLQVAYKPSSSKEGKKKGWVIALAKTPGEQLKDALLASKGGWAKMSAMIADKGETIFASQIIGHTAGE